MFGTGSLSLTFTPAQVRALSVVSADDKENDSPPASRGNVFGKFFRKALRKSARHQESSSQRSSSPDSEPSASLQLSHVVVSHAGESYCGRAAAAPRAGRSAATLPSRGVGSLDGASGSFVIEPPGGWESSAEECARPQHTSTDGACRIVDLKNPSAPASSSSTSSSRRSSSSISAKFERAASRMSSAVSTSLLSAARTHMSNLLSSLSSRPMLASGSFGAPPSGPYVGPFDAPFNPKVLSVGHPFPQAVRFRVLSSPFGPPSSQQASNPPLALPALASLFQCQSSATPRFAVLDFYVSRTRSVDPVIAVDP